MASSERGRVERRRLVGSALRELRIEANLRQEDIAVRLGKPQSYVSKYESGEQSLDLIEVGAICHASGSSLLSFVTQFETRLRASK